VGHFVDTVNIHNLLICFCADMYGKTWGKWSQHSCIAYLSSIWQINTVLYILWSLWKDLSYCIVYYGNESFYQTNQFMTISYY